MLKQWLFWASIVVVTVMSVGHTASLHAQSNAATEVSQEVSESSIGGEGIIARAWRGGFVVFFVLLILVGMSVITWAVLFAKWLTMGRIERATAGFVKSFWDSRSLNDLNGKLADFPHSPVKEVFRTGYGELIRGHQVKGDAVQSELGLSVAIDNLTRSLQKAKQVERKSLERYLSMLAISASVSPFIGLFGTVWGIMSAFEGIARTGSASLAAVAPGISEALIATAFGLAAAIPAVVGYNVFNAKIRGQMISVDGFAADFLNIVERYLVSDRSKGHAGSASAQPVGASGQSL